MPTTSTLPNPRLAAATLGLAACYALNDGEELLTYPDSSRWLLSRLPAWVPVPEEVRREGWTQDHVNVAVGLIGLYWVGASVAGYRTYGRSAWFQNALLTWGLHGFGHLAMARARRGYVSGVATAPLVVGYWLWARHTLRAEGVPNRTSVAGALAAFPALVAAHTLAELATRWGQRVH